MSVEADRDITSAEQMTLYIQPAMGMRDDISNEIHFVPVIDAGKEGLRAVSIYHHH